jgi:hypothetical protein
MAWLIGQMLSYWISGLVPVSEKPSVLQSQPPCADGHTARMFAALVLVDEASHTFKFR